MWDLTANPDDALSLFVGKECPYYQEGHKEARIEIDGQGEIVGINGPGDEFYTKAEVHEQP